MSKFSNLCLLLIFALLPKESQAIFCGEVAVGSISLYVKAEVKNEETSVWGGDEKKDKSTYVTPEAGRPWKVVSEEIRTEGLNSENTYSVKYIPSKSNVEKIEVRVSAKR